MRGEGGGKRDGRVGRRERICTCCEGLLSQGCSGGIERKLNGETRRFGLQIITEQTEREDC